MKLSQITLLAFLCLPGYIFAPSEEEIENRAPVEHTKELSEQEAFEKHLKSQAEQHYKDGDRTGLRTWNYKKRAMDLDNDIKRHLINSSNHEKLSEIDLNLLRSKLEQRIQEEDKEKTFSSAGLRKDLETLHEKVKKNIDEKHKRYKDKGTENTITHYRKDFARKTQESENVQKDIPAQEKELEKSEKQILSLQRDLAYSEKLVQKARNENNPDLAEEIEKRMKKSEQKINILKSKITDSIKTIEDSIDRTNLNQEDIGTALLEILKPTIPQETIERLTSLIKTIERTEFIDIQTYTDATNPKEISEEKIKNIEKVIEELSNIIPQTLEIANYINFLKKEVKNHFIKLQNESFKQFNDVNSEDLKLKSEILTLNNKIQQSQKVLDVLKTESEIEKSKEFIKQRKEEILADEKLLEQTTDETEVERIQNSIKLIKKEIDEEFLELGLNQKDIESYESLPKLRTELIEQEENLKKVNIQSTKLWSLQNYFATQAKNYASLD